MDPASLSFANGGNAPIIRASNSLGPPAAPVPAATPGFPPIGV